MDPAEPSGGTATTRPGERNFPEAYVKPVFSSIDNESIYTARLCRSYNRPKRTSRRVPKNRSRGAESVDPGDPGVRRRKKKYLAQRESSDRKDDIDANNLV